MDKSVSTVQMTIESITKRITERMKEKFLIYQTNQENLKELITEQMKELLGNNIIYSVKEIEESEEMKMIREVMEVPNDTITFQITLNSPIKFIISDFEV